MVCPTSSARPSMELPEKNGDYKRVDYWDSRYTEEEHFDWFTSYSAFRHLVLETVKHSDRILMLGCGNSSLSREMYEDGYRHITNLDYSTVVIENMRQQHSDLPEMQWDAMDMLNMTYEDGSFDVVMEKGTLDALLVEEKSPWTMSQESQDLIHTTLSKVSSLLAVGGRFISITFADPFFRKPLYGRHEYCWDINVSAFGDSFHFYYLTMTKGTELSEEDRQLRELFEHRHNNPSPLPRAGSSSESEDEDFITNIDPFS